MAADFVIAKTLVFCDLSRGYFVQDRYNAELSPNPFAQFFSKDNLNLDIYPMVLQPSVAFGSNDPFDQVSLSGIAVVLAIFDPIGTLLASQSTFTSNPSTGILTGQLNCDTVPMAAYVTSDPKAVIIEARFTGATFAKNVRANSFVRQQFNTGATPITIPNPAYPTLDEMKALFIQRQTSPGDSILWISPDGTKKKLQFQGDDDVMHFDEVT